MPFTVTPDQVAFYKENGFVALGKLTTDEELETIRQIYDRLFADRKTIAKENTFDLAGDSEDRPTLPQILGPSNFAPELRETQLWQNAKIAAQALLGIEIEGFGDHAILKPAGYGAPTPWHQDEAYWDPNLDYDSLSIWIPLQDATVEGGCMHFLPATHKLEILPHQPIDNNPKTHGLELATDLPTATTPTPCPLKAGECTVHHNRTLHYAGPNTTQTDRRALILGTGHPATPRQSPRTFPWQEAQKAAGAPAS